ncbi:MAG: protein translocase subunit SecF [Pseudomonadota bacterium]
MKSSASTKARFDILGKRKLAMIVSAVLLIVSIIAIATRGLSFGVDFTGGYLIEVAYPDSVELAPIRSALGVGGFDDALVQHFGSASDVLVRLAPREGVNSAELSQNVLDVLGTQSDDVAMRRVEFVGPQVGEELREQGGLAVLYALIGIVIYIWLRFEKKFSIGSVAALVHDVLIVVGFFALLQIEFDLSVLAAILAVIGYSLNDTIVVFDRVRENFRKLRKGTPLEIANISINQTLSRTVITSMTTLLVLLALYVLGGEVIAGFAVALIIGVLIGTYSSIFVACTTVLALGITKQDLMPVEKEGADVDAMP